MAPQPGSEQAAVDLQRGLVDTDRGPTLDEVYEHHVAGRELEHAERLAAHPELRLCWTGLPRVRGAWHRARGDGLEAAAAAWRESVVRSHGSGALLFERHAAHEWAQACEVSGRRDKAREMVEDVMSASATTPQR